MSFREVPGQDEAAAFFRRALSADRMAHAYILVGPEGLGQRKLARAMAEYLFCEDPNDDACGVCRNCRRIVQGNFPDLHWFAREEGKRDLPVDEIKRLLREISLKPIESIHKVFVLEEAERLNRSSANRLLKILEEPPPHSLLLLLALDVRDFLPTILSRCQVIRLRPLRTPELTKRLVEKGNCSPDEAEYLSRFTMGSTELACELAAGTFFEDRALLIDRVSGLVESEHFAAADEIEKRLGSEKESAQVRRERLLRFMDVLALFYRDVLVTTLGADVDDLINRDRTGDIRRLADRLSTERVERVLKSIEETRVAINSNANRKLLLGNLTFAVANAQAV